MVPLRRTLRLHLDDLLGVTRDFLIPHVSRSGLYRCLRRHSVRNPNALKPQALSEPHKAFKSNVIVAGGLCVILATALDLIILLAQRVMTPWTRARAAT